MTLRRWQWKAPTNWSIELGRAQGSSSGPTDGGMEWRQWFTELEVFAGTTGLICAVLSANVGFAASHTNEAESDLD